MFWVISSGSTFTYEVRDEAINILFFPMNLNLELKLTGIQTQDIF